MIKTFLLMLHVLSGTVVFAQYSALDLKGVQKRLLPAFASLAELTPVTDLTYDEVKQQRQIVAAKPWPELLNADSVAISDIQIPGLMASDPEIPVKVYTPKNVQKDLPVLIWFHGGGYIYGTPKWDHQRCADYALKGNVIVVNVDYRFAPEHPFPAALNDGYAVLKWIKEHGKALGLDTNLIAIGGGSAGAGLAATITQYARDHQGPKICLQVLHIIPGDFKTDYPSTIEFKAVPGLKADDFQVMQDFYIGKNGDPKQLYVMPNNITSVRNLPPAVFYIAGADPLRDSGMAYAERLIKAGIFTELHVFAGYAHGMPLPGELDITVRMMKQFLK